MKNLANERAAFAYKEVLQIVEKNDEKNKKEFVSLIRTIPAKIQMTGLATTIAFLFAKKKPGTAHEKVYNMIANWLLEKNYLESNSKSKNLLMEKITTLRVAEYQMMMNEVQQLLVWIKRFAEGMIKNDKI